MCVYNSEMRGNEKTNPNKNLVSWRSVPFGVGSHICFLLWSHWSHSLIRGGEDYGLLSDGLSLLGFFKGSTLFAFLVGGPLVCGFVGCSKKVSSNLFFLIVSVVFLWKYLNKILINRFGCK
ncbi:hypothetical protein Lser_V15G02348 [Lactuca serriola]